MKRKHRPEIDYTGWTKEQHIEHLKKERAYFKHYEKIDSTDIDEFIEEYATLKTELYEKKEELATKYERHETQFLTKADYYIDTILQKKLLNLQCLWRANKIQLPLICVIDDFDYWQENIRACPFIAPITEQEIEICVRFLLEEIDWDDNEYNDTFWQNLDGFKFRMDYERYSEDERKIHEMTGCNEDEIPRLYTFFDKHLKTAYLLDLEDLRGPIESAYYNQAEEMASEGYEETLIKEGKWDEMMDFDENGVSKTMEYYFWMHSLRWAKFVERAEDQQTRELFRQWEYFRRKEKKSIYYERITVHSLKNDPTVYFDFLQEFEEVPAIEAQSGDNWRIALERTARKFKQIRVAEVLPYAYETYLLGFENLDNIPRLIAQRVACYTYDTTTKHYDSMMENREFILDGREALTGKRDFDYL
jgi:hypothetical protein